MGFLLYITCVLFSCSFQYFPLFWIFSILTMICHRVFLFCYYSVGVLCASYICMGMFFLSLVKCFSMILLKMWSMLVIWDSSPSSMSIIQKFFFFLKIMPHISCMFFFVLLKFFSCSFLSYSRSSTLSSSILLSAWFILLVRLRPEFYNWDIVF